MNYLFSVFCTFVLKIRSILWKTVSKGRKTHELKLYEGHSYKFGSFGDIVRILYMMNFLVRFKKSFEYETLHKFKSILKKGDVVIDIGANIGMYSLFSADLVGAKGKVYAIEASAQTYQHLEHNIALNSFSNIVASNIAVGEEVGFAKLVVPKYAGKNYSDSFKSMDFSDTLVETEKVETTTIITLDQYVEQQGITNIKLIKIDIEGAELLCLKGASGVLSGANRPIIIFECSEQHCERFNYTAADIIYLLKDFDYELKQYEYKQWIAYPKN